MLNFSYKKGVLTGLHKYALEAPTLADAFPEAVENGTDVPPKTGVEQGQPMPPPPDPHTALSQYLEGAKAAALGIKEMLELEGLMGKADAGNMFHEVAQQFKGHGGAVSKTLNIQPNGMRLPDTIRSRRPIPPPIPFGALQPH